jgi:N6-L-threonylcarbamoyladenine synthase
MPATGLIPAPASSLGRSSGLILAIETSCDETAAAVVRSGREILSNVIASQIAEHALYGGVVPEIASREHIRHIVPVVRRALAEARVSLDQIDAIAVTEGPGLAGALLVGIGYAKAMALALDKPLIAVNHLEGHIHSALLSSHTATAPLEFPALALVVSGGHTHLYLVSESSRLWSYKNVGRTVDDAAGEAFDKAAKMLGLGYPGGPWISALAAYGNPRAVPFSFAQIKTKAHGGPRSHSASDLDPLTYFSFSGIKTAVARYIELNSLADGIAARRRLLAANPSLTPADLLPHCDAKTLDLIASFQHAVVEDLVRKTLRTAERFAVRTLLISGGVAANQQLRTRFEQESSSRGIALHFPTPGLSTDNAAMIAAAAWPKFVAHRLAEPSLTAHPSLAL